MLLNVLTDAICNGSNESDVYVPHEKIDGCKSYVRCYNNIPSGHLCGPQLCFDHQQTVTRCNWCIDVSCESEMGPTTEGIFCLMNAELVSYLCSNFKEIKWFTTTLPVYDHIYSIKPIPCIRML